MSLLSLTAGQQGQRETLTTCDHNSAKGVLHFKKIMFPLKGLGKKLKGEENALLEGKKTGLINRLGNKRQYSPLYF